MISIVSGQVLELGAHRVVLDVSGVGFEIAITPRHSITMRLGEKATLFTRLVVREDDLSLFGFASSVEREQFDDLCAVSGIGPKLALTALGGMTVEQIQQAVQASDEAAFRAISGIGPKTAKLILISLSGKSISEANPVKARVIEALIQLGTDEQSARRVVGGLEAELSESEMLKQALGAMGAGKLS